MTSSLALRRKRPLRLPAPGRDDTNQTFADLSRVCRTRKPAVRNTLQNRLFQKQGAGSRGAVLPFAPGDPPPPPPPEGARPREGRSQLPAPAPRLKTAVPGTREQRRTGAQEVLAEKAKGRRARSPAQGRGQSGSAGGRGSARGCGGPSRPPKVPPPEVAQRAPRQEARAPLAGAAGAGASPPQPGS